VSETPTITVETAIEAGDWGEVGHWEGLAARVAAAVAVRPELDVPDDAELSLLLTDDAHIRVLNRAWRGKDTPTNVLSFPSADADEDPGPLLGDVVVARETTGREAAADALSFDDHFTHLLVHGLLHLFGFDHEVDEEAEEMEALETEILAGLGIADPYGDREPARDATDD
jgi:probable rRNA maturation factor